MARAAKGLLSLLAGCAMHGRGKKVCMRRWALCHDIIKTPTASSQRKTTLAAFRSAGESAKSCGGNALTRSLKVREREILSRRAHGFATIAALFQLQ